MIINDALKYRDELVKYAKRMVGCEAEDVVQDLFEYWMKARMPSSPTPKALLRWYVKNKCIDHIRKKNLHNTAIENIKHLDSMDIFKDRFSPPDTESEKIDLVLDRLQNIDPFARQLFVLNKVMGVSLVEIEKETGINRRRLTYIQINTKKILKDVTEEKE